jgi:hypothetical protein
MCSLKSLWSKYLEHPELNRTNDELETLRTWKEEIARGGFGATAGGTAAESIPPPNSPLFSPLHQSGPASNRPRPPQSSYLSKSPLNHRLDHLALQE